MSTQVRVFSLIGDSNVKNHMTPTNCRAKDVMSSSQVLICTKAAIFEQTLRSIRNESTCCIISCVSNFITDADMSISSISHRVDPVFDDFFSKIAQACTSRTERYFLICPPMYRRSPVWYRDALPEIMTRYTMAYAKHALLVKNLIVMPSFPTPAFEKDGVHLTAYAGFEFVLHLFDTAEMLLKNQNQSPSEVSVKVTEGVRSLEDRMMVVEQNQHDLRISHDLKFAVDAELACFRSNERSEDSFLISGLSKIPNGLSGKDWQFRAQSDVHKVISELMSREFKIIVVRNVTGRGADSEVTYSVRLDNVEDARSIRSRFSSFFKKGEDTRPTHFKNISIRNVVTKETRIRIALLKLFASKYSDSNPGSKVQVVGYEPRPLLKITPPQNASDRRIMTFNFIEATQKLPKNFTDEELSKIVRQAAFSFAGQLKQLFVIINDDMVRSARNRKRVADSDATGEPPRQRSTRE